MSRLQITPDAADAARLAAHHPHQFRRFSRGRLAGWGGVALLVFTALYAARYLGLSADHLGSGSAKFIHLLTLMVPPDPGTHLPLYLHALAETLAIAFLGTLFGALIALPFGCLAAINVVSHPVLHFCARRALDILRGIDRLVWALIFVTVVGLGPFAGILAIVVFTVGELGKLFSEAIEAVDRRPVEGVRAAGGSRLHQMRYGLLPQVVPVFLSQTLYYMESNARQSTIVGIVGAGGLGLHLAEQIRVLEWHQVSFLILMMLAMVAAIDAVSTRLRFAFIGRRQVQT